MVVRPDLNANLLRGETRTSPASIPSSPTGKPEKRLGRERVVVCVREQIIEVAVADAQTINYHVYLMVQNTTTRRHNHIVANYCETSVISIIIIIIIVLTCPSPVVNYRVPVRRHFQDKPLQTVTVVFSGGVVLICQATIAAIAFECLDY